MNNPTLPTLDDLCNLFVSLRDRKAALEDAHKAQLEGVEADIALVKRAMLKLFPEGATSLRTSHGTITKATKTKFSAMDMTAFIAFVESNRRTDLLERRVAQKSVQTYVDSTGTLPPGIHAVSEVTLSIRKAS